MEKKVKKYLIIIIVLLILIIGPSAIFGGLSKSLSKLEAIDWTNTFKSLGKKAYSQLIFNKHDETPPPEDDTPPNEDPPPVEENPFYDKEEIAFGNVISNLYVNATQEGIEAMKKVSASWIIENEPEIISICSNLSIRIYTKNFLQYIENIFGAENKTDWENISDSDFFIAIFNFNDGGLCVIYSTMDYSNIFTEQVDKPLHLSAVKGWQNINEEGEIIYEGHSLSGETKIIEMDDITVNEEQYLNSFWGGRENFNKIFRCNKAGTDIVSNAILNKLYINTTLKSINAMKTALSASGTNKLSFRLGVDDIEISLVDGTYFGFDKSEVILFLKNMAYNTYLPLYSTISFAYEKNGYTYCNFLTGWQNIDKNGIGSGEIDFDCGKGYSLENWGGQENFNKIFRGDIKAFIDYGFYGKTKITEGANVSKIFLNNSEEGLQAIKTALNTSGQNSIAFNINSDYKICLTKDIEGVSNADFALIMIDVKNNWGIALYSTFDYSDDYLIYYTDIPIYKKYAGWYSLFKNCDIENGEIIFSSFGSIKGIINFDTEGGDTIENWGGQENFNKIFRCD